MVTTDLVDLPWTGGDLRRVPTISCSMDSMKDIMDMPGVPQPGVTPEVTALGELAVGIPRSPNGERGSALPVV